MDPISQSPFSRLPTELALIIFKYAAQPTFYQTEKYEAKSPYSSALSLCFVSKLVRRAVLPELLHTILLPKSDNLRMFVRALLMQKEYAEIRNNLRLNCREGPNNLYFEYAPHIHKIWIGCSGEDIVLNHLLPPNYAPARNLTISVLSTVLLAVPSLALSWISLKLFSECLEHAWKSHTDTNASDEHAPPPWNTRILMLSGETVTNGPWELLTNTPQGSAFLASISHLTYGSYITVFDPEFFQAMYGGFPRNYHLPSWMRSIPWLYLKNLQTFSLAYPHIKPPFDVYEFRELGKGRSFHVELLTLSAALLTRRRDDRRDWRINGFAEAGPGKECVRSERVCLKVSHSSIQFWHDKDDWERVWACGLYT